MEQVYDQSHTGELSSRMPAANVGNVERLVTLAAGAAMLGYAWKHRSTGLGLTSAGLLARGATGYCPAYGALGVNHATDSNHAIDSRRALSGAGGLHVRESISINASPEELYRFWRQLDRLPQVMPHLEKVEQLDGKRSRWTAKAFDQVPVTWQAEIINELPFETIAWKTLPGETIQNAGSVTFKPIPGTNATDVRINLQYAPPGGRAAGWFAWLVGQDPAKLTRDGLQALKRHFESRPINS